MAQARVDRTEQPGAATGKPPRVTAIVRVFQRTAYYLQAVNSVLAQISETHPAEILLLHDLEEPGAVSELEARGVRAVYSTERDQGAALERAIAGASGDVLTFLDDDDLFAPGKLAKVRELFSHDPSLGYYHHGMHFFSGPALPAASVAPPKDYAYALGIRAAELLSHRGRTRADLRRLWFHGGAYNLSSMVVRREVVTPVLPYLRRVTCGCSPFLFWAAVVSPYSMCVDPTPLTWLRIHGANTSGIGGESARARQQEAYRRAPLHVRDAKVMLEMLRDSRVDPRLEQPLRSTLARNLLMLPSETSGIPPGERVRALVDFLSCTPPGLIAVSSSSIALASLRLLSPGNGRGPSGA